MRWVAYLVQWIFFVLLCIGLLIWLLAIDVFGLVKLVCNGQDMLLDLSDQLDMDMETQVDQLGEDCEGTVRLWMYLGWVAAFTITVPL